MTFMTVQNKSVQEESAAYRKTKGKESENERERDIKRYNKGEERAVMERG